jgi:hypothetical protein
VAADRGQLEGATRLYGAIEAVVRAQELGLPLLGRADHQRTLAAARRRLDEAAYLAVWAEGQAMTPEQAIAAALQCLQPTRGGVCPTREADR